MGCFDFTCAISALPIAHGVPVVALMIQEARFERYGPWAIRSLPVYGEYNDYGSIENYPDDIRTRAWVESLKHDVIEKGVGDNEYHDIGYRKESTFEQLLKSLWQHGQVQVNLTGLRLPDPDHKYEPAKAPLQIPSIANIEELLGDLKPSVLIDETNSNEFRVRRSNYCADSTPRDESFALMEQCMEKLLPHYAVMHSCGSGGYSHGDSELVVRPKPGAKREDGHTASVHRWDPEFQKTIGTVTMVMIRRDVWDLLLTAPMFKTAGHWDIKRWRMSQKAILAFMFRKRAALTKKMSHKKILAAMMRDYEARSAVGHYGTEYPFINKMARRFEDFETSPEEIKILKQDCLDLLHVTSVMYTYLRMKIHPRNLMGEQHGDLKIIGKYHLALSKLLRAQEKANEERWG